MSLQHNEDLFRKQAIQSLSRKMPGRPICVVPRPWAWLSLLAVLLFSSALVLAGGAEYSRTESVRGWLISKKGIVKLTARDAAVVREVPRQPGERVRKGDPLIYLSRDSILAGGNSKSQEVLGQLRHALIEIDRQIALSKKQQRLDEMSLQQQMQSFEVEVSALTSRLNDQRRLLGLRTEKLQRLERASIDGAVTQWDVIKQEEDVETTAQELRRLQQDKANQQREHEQLAGREKRLALQAEVLRSTLRARRTQLSQQIVEQEAQQTSVLESPVDGVIGSIEVHVGNSVASNQLLVTMVPLNADLEAEVFVPSRAVGFIQRGQAVRISYDAFPQEKFGKFEGRINRISNYVLLPGEIPQTFPIREATYKIQIALMSSSLDTSLGVIALRPGMLLAAEIILEKRNLIDWLLEPLRLRRSADS